MSFKVTTEIPTDRIVNLMITAIESGDPVTFASKGGWCDGIYWHSRRATPLMAGTDPWYARPLVYDAKDFQIEVVEVDDETTGHKTGHIVRRENILAGLKTMAEKFPNYFAQILEDNIDAPCADIFLQSVCFGEERYA